MVNECSKENDATLTEKFRGVLNDTKLGGVLSNTDLIYNQLRSSTPEICIKFTMANKFIQVRDVTLTQKKTMKL